MHLTYVTSSDLFPADCLLIAVNPWVTGSGSVHLGGYNKVPNHWWLRSNGNALPTALEPGGLRARGQRAWVLAQALVQAVDSYHLIVSSWGAESKAALWGLPHYKGSDPIHSLCPGERIPSSHHHRGGEDLNWGFLGRLVVGRASRPRTLAVGSRPASSIAGALGRVSPGWFSKPWLVLGPGQDQEW